jgi:uncharacterized protein (DUF1330 family)
MPAYVISEVKVLDEDLIGQYRALAEASIEKYGGRYLVRAGALELVEGERDEDRQYILVESPPCDGRANGTPRPSMPRH